MEAAITRVGATEAEQGISVTIDRSPEVVFAALANVAGHTDWARGPEEIVAVSSNPAQLGTTWQQVHKMLGRKVVANMQVDSYEQNRQFGFSTDKPFPMRMLFSLAPASKGTELRLVASGEPDSLFGKLAVPMLTKALQRQMEADLYTLKAILENGG